MIINGVAVREDQYVATVGWHWNSREGDECVITWDRHTTRMTWGECAAGQDIWSKQQLVGRWANTERTIAGARAIVRAFLAEWPGSRP
jgi:hypothetical protein